MNKDLNKIQAGDFVRSSYSGEIGLVIDTPNGLHIIFNKSHDSLTKEYDYRRVKDCYGFKYMPDKWKESWEKAEPIFQDEIDITVKVNGKEVPLSKISDETLINIKNNS